MTHSERVQKYESYMAAQGVPRSTASPKLWQWLWSCGIECPPPPFMNRAALALCFGVGLSLIPVVLWLYSYFRHPLRHHMPVHGVIWIVGGSFVVGALLGPVYYRRLARRCGLASWSTFHGKRQAP
jgi:hypothetical protein